MMINKLTSFYNLAERQGFEPWEGCPSTVFKTAAFDRSATSPTGQNNIAIGSYLQSLFIRKKYGNRYNGTHLIVCFCKRLVRIWVE